MEVPLNVCLPVSLVWSAETMLLPGAQISTQDPKLLKPERASVLVVEPTVTAEGTNAGEKKHASELVLPAATTTVTPALTAASTAACIALCVPWPPKLMLEMVGLFAFVASQSKAS